METIDLVFNLLVKAKSMSINDLCLLLFIMQKLMFTSHLKKHSKNCTQHFTLDYVIYHCNILQSGNIVTFSICRKAIAENCFVQGHTTIIWLNWDVNPNISDSKINNLIHRSHSFYKIK